MNLRHLVLLVTLTLAVAAPATRVAAQDPATIAAIAQMARSAPEFFHKGVQAAEMARRMFHGGFYPLWYCRYADGTIVYNKFRAYRDAKAVLAYFMGRPGSHDCDAYYYRGRAEIRFCTRQALRFARAHGGIVEVRVSPKQ